MAKKRGRKLQLKLEEAINIDNEDKEALAIIAKKAYEEGRVSEPQDRKYRKDSQLSAEGKKCQQDAQDRFYRG